MQNCDSDKTSIMNKTVQLTIIKTKIRKRKVLVL